MAMGNNHMYELLRPLGGNIRAVGQRDQNGWTALHVAAFKGRMDAVKELVEDGAELEAVDDAGYTPFKCAVEAGNVEVALWLIRCGARGSVKGFLMATGGGGGRVSAWAFSAAMVSSALC
ncbi:26S proteasome non-ATPase regulatory subunit 10-like [Phalaenopsis equestris]|uniref:26S proteasome non-ATPase regulatory subunit 10-like n=1 Tax=Phalaenopsis equestris TaxID=78828 RepID=UPI0009E55B4F|nr:26S proteasome non-ATPase regulatory subunit 10-like [Phalaenopsis equestris]